MLIIGESSPFSSLGQAADNMCPTADMRAVIQFLYIPDSLQEAYFLQYGKLNNKINISVLEWTFPGRE